MARKARVISIDLDARTARFMESLRDAEGRLRSFGREGHEAVTSVQATSGALRVLEGNMTSNLRAAERFVASVLGLGPALQTIFPLVGATALLGLLGELDSKAVQFYKSLRDAGSKARSEFLDAQLSLSLTNDGLRIANDRIEQNIAKLEGRRENTLALALDEARESADKLGKSLDGDIKSLQKLLESNKSDIWSQLLGEMSDSGLREMIGGKSGFEGFLEKINDITFEGESKIRAAATTTQAGDERKAMDARLHQAYAELIAWINGQIASEEQKKSAVAANPFVIDPVSGASTPNEFDPKFLAKLKGARRIVTEQDDRVTLESKALTDKQQDDQLAADERNRKADAPFVNKLRQLQNELTVTQAKFDALGQPSGVQVAMKAFEEATKSIGEVNKAMERTLTPLEEEFIRVTDAELAAKQAELEWHSKMTSGTEASRERVASLELLTAAIGKSFDATRQANIESKIAQQLGAHVFDPQWMGAHAADISTMRGQATQEFDAEHTRQMTENLDRLREQIKAEQALSQAQKEGAEAVRLASLANRIRLLEQSGVTKELIAAERELADEQKKNASEESIAKIKQRIEAVQQLMAATLLGAEAERKATLESKYADMKFAGKSDEEIQETRIQDNLDHQEAIRKSALSTGMGPIDRIKQIDEEVLHLRAVQQEGDKRLAIEVSIRNLQKERIDLLAKETLEQRRAIDGVRAFFIEVQQQARSTAQIVYDALNSALDRTSENLAKNLTGQKSNWAQSFQQIGTEMLQSQLKSGLQKGLGQLAGLFGVDVHGKRDGSDRNLAFFVEVVNPGGGSGGGGGIASNIPVPGAGGGQVFSGADGTIFHMIEGAQEGEGAISGLADSAGGGAAEGGGGGLQKLLGLIFGGFRAEGGGVDPGHAYVVGENGPELFSPGQAGTISPNGAAGAGGGSVTYHIDARGADLGAAGRIRRAIEASHKGAVTSSVQANIERGKRTPR